MKKFFPLFLFFSLSLIYAGFQFGLLGFWFGNAASPDVIAHRGDCAHAPENTLIAFRLALQKGADGIELDVQNTKDRIPLVFHDSTLKRIFSDNSRVDEMTVFELKKLAPEADSSQSSSVSPLCTLEEVLRLRRLYPEARFHLDLKSPDAKEKVVSLIEKYDLSDHCEIASQDPSVLKCIKELNPDIHTVLLISSYKNLAAYKYGDIFSLFPHTGVVPSPEYVDGISVRSSLLSLSLIRYAHQRNQSVYAWTVNSDSEIRRMCQLGADSIITDNPSYAMRCIYADH